jgi:hypothetical protein
MIVIPDNSPTASQRDKSAMQDAQEHDPTILGEGKTALLHTITDTQKIWLLDYSVERFSSFWNSLSDWRARLAKYERMAEDEYSDRIGTNDPLHSDAPQRIFDRNNFSFGVVNGFADFAYAQSVDDLFGTRPWFSATPQGAESVHLADLISKHAQWKLDQSNAESVCKDAVRNAVDLGTGFVKCRWQKVIETSKTLRVVAWSKSNNALILGAGGDIVEDEDELKAMGVDGADVAWQEFIADESRTAYDNVVMDLIDYRNIAFDHMAPELNLLRTDVFQKFKIGILDAKALYDLTDEQTKQLRTLVFSGDAEEARANRGENGTATQTALAQDDQANPVIHLVEGYVRCDPMGGNSPVRIKIVFHPQCNILITADYLANETPDAILPIFPVRCFKIPGRIVGRGYFERYESPNDFVDTKFNEIAYRDRITSNPPVGFHEDALADGSDDEDLKLAPGKMFKLLEGKSLKDLIEVLELPDTSNRADKLMEQMVQFMQLRTGISTASQGEVASVPQSNTATGVEAIISRGAALMRWPLQQIKEDLIPSIEYDTFLIYDNADQAETFVWGEGKDAELLAIQPGDVKGLRCRVSMSMTSNQNSRKLQSAQVAINIGAMYLNLSEADKVSQKRLYVDALQLLGFPDADKIIRDGIVDPMGILQILPPNMQPMFEQFLQAIGMLPPTAQAGAPSSESVPPAPSEQPQAPPAAAGSPDAPVDQEQPAT